MADLITTHAADALARLPESRKGKDNLAHLISTMGIQVQELEQALYELLTERQIDTAVGVQLDAIGEIVGQPRAGESDDDYRRMVRARIAANNSEGRVADFIRVTRAVINDATLAVRPAPGYPAAMVIHVEAGILSDAAAQILIELLRDTRAGGVRVLAHYLTAEPEDSFTFGSHALILGPGLSIGAGGTEIITDGISGFLPSGSLVLDPSGANEETVTYTAISLNSFVGVAGITNTHVIGTALKQADDSSQGFSDTTAPTTGGALSSILE